MCVGFFLLWQTAPWTPPAALDVLLLLFLGWRFAPLIPAAALAHWFLFHGVQPLLAVLVAQSAGAAIFAVAIWYVKEKQRVALPLRTIREVALFCGIVCIAAPLVAGLCTAAIYGAFGLFAPNEMLGMFAQAMLSYPAPVVAIVPSVITFAGWRQLDSPAEHTDPSRAELTGFMVATAVLVIAGIVISLSTNQPLLDFSFITISWLAMRYGLRGAVLGISTAFVAATGMHAVIEHGASMPANSLAEYEGFLIASSLMALLLGGLTTERWELLARLSRRAYVDELTGLPNRDRLVEWIERHHDSAVVLIILDVDDMRVLNQGVGRTAVDRVLQDMAVRLRASFPTSHFIARVSADEFSVSVVDDRSPHALMSELRAFFEVPFEIDGSRVYISVSMGAVRMVRAGSADDMLRKADLALDKAKLSPTRSMVYAPELQAGTGPSLVGELHQAVVRRELVPFFQPIFRYDSQNGDWRVVGAEALLRWIHPDRGIVSPASFIDMLERLSIGEHVGWNVMEQALLQAGEWRRAIPNFRVWVNLFGRQALSRNCAQRIAELLESTAVPADALLVEINESIIASDERDVSALVQRLREMGVHTAIDDFGTGGSSLGRVRDVPAGVLKIDRSFVTRSEVDSKAKAVAATVVRLAEELGMMCVAEGCENMMQLQVMNDIGCEYAQGYALGHPLPADLFARTFLSLESASGF